MNDRYRYNHFMYVMIERVFHPIGQGAFYSERHGSHNINIVYDCGTTNPKSLAKQSVVRTFKIEVQQIIRFFIGSNP